MKPAPTILIIDDDADDRAAVRALLEDMGAGVVEAASGRAGLAAARLARPDLIILDLMLENLTTGYSLVQALKHSRDFKDLAHVPILMVSSVETSPGELFRWVGATRWIEPDAYLSKPIDVRMFMQRVRELLDRASPGAAARGEPAPAPAGPDHGSTSKQGALRKGEHHERQDEHPDR